jgi:hypothetical protein
MGLNHVTEVAERICLQAMRSPTSLHENRVYSQKKSATFRPEQVQQHGCAKACYSITIDRRCLYGRTVLVSPYTRLAALHESGVGRFCCKSLCLFRLEVIRLL